MLPTIDQPTPRRQTGGREQPSGRASPEIPLESLRRLIATTGKRLLAATIIGAVIGGLLMFLQPIRYDAVATLMVSQPKFSPDAKPINVATFRALLETNALASSAISQFHLDAPPYRMKPDDFLKDTLILEELRNANLIRVRARMADPKVAADLANFVALEAIELNEQIDQQDSVDFRGQLQSQLDAATKRLRAAEGQLLDFRKRSQLDLVKRDADSALAERGELLRLTVDIEAEKARLASAEKEIQRQERMLPVPRLVDAEAALRALPVEPLGRPVRPAAPGVPPAEIEENTTTVDSTSSHDRRPDAARTGDRNKAAKDERQAPVTPPAADERAREADQQEQRVNAGAGLDLSNPFINPVYQVLDYQIALSRTKLAALERRRRELVGAQALGGKELTSLAALYPQEIQLRRLETEHELAQTVYAEIAVQYERARLQVASVSARLQLIDKAIQPTVPLPRHRLLGAIIGAIAGFAVALVVLATRQFLVLAA
ncbi:MAG: hypothetical protein HOQ29_04765 [Acidobacteria bacterium]|nr:hypothetical protein [Acidobacteriota bacterium]